MIFQGRIAQIMPIQSGTGENGKEWRKQEFVFEYFENPTDRWSDKVILSIHGDNIEKYALQEGEEVIIGFGHNISKEWKGRVFNELRMYKFERVSGAKSSPQSRESVSAGSNATEQTKTQPAQNNGQNGDDDLPF